MNKKLLAVAVGATLAASAGAAMAEVTVYGMAHVSVDMIDADRSPANTEVTNAFNVSDNSSRFGIKAKEDFGGGWAGLAQFEIFVNNTDPLSTTASTTADTTSVTANRNNYVGIEHKSAGKLLLGRMDSAVKDVGGVADLFYREQIGESRAIINYFGTDGRNNESVTFDSAKFGPVDFKLQWVGNDSDTNTNTGINANVMGYFGPVTAGLGYYKNETTGDNTDGYRLGVKGKVGPVVLTALYQSATAANVERNAYGIGAGWTFGNNTIKAQYYLADSTDTSTVDNGASLLAVGYDYHFSKKTVVYANYAMVENDAGTTSFSLGGNGHGESYTTNVAGGSVSGFSIGTRMSF